MCHLGQRVCCDIAGLENELGSPIEDVQSLEQAVDQRGGTVEGLTRRLVDTAQKTKQWNCPNASDIASVRDRLVR